MAMLMTKRAEWHANTLSSIAAYARQMGRFVNARNSAKRSVRLLWVAVPSDVKRLPLDVGFADSPDGALLEPFYPRASSDNYATPGFFVCRTLMGLVAMSYAATAETSILQLVKALLHRGAFFELPG
jgi:hypothetical protein